MKRLALFFMVAAILFVGALYRIWDAPGSVWIKALLVGMFQICGLMSILFLRIGRDQVARKANLERLATDRGHLGGSTVKCSQAVIRDGGR